VGRWMQISNSNLVELMCSSPYEWIAFDMELRRAFDIGPIWDGYDIIHSLSRIISK
jgi:2-keto-3-deoxy-L-rhamnonate aldolase RhmA